MYRALLGAKHLCGKVIYACGTVFARQTPEVVLVCATSGEPSGN